MRKETQNIAAAVAFLAGTFKPKWVKFYGDECKDLLLKLEKDQNAVTIRYLCKLRTSIMLHYTATDNAIMNDLKNINRLDKWYDTVNIKQLEKWGHKIVLTNKRASDYIIHFNDLIQKNIDKCQGLFPDWLNWGYIKNLFIAPQYNDEAARKREFTKYMDNLKFYPYQVYINWKPFECGNLLISDIKFLEILYGMNNDYFAYEEECHDAAPQVKNNIYDFINRASKIVMAVDCENSNPYKLYSVIKNLHSDEINKISKIILYDDRNTANGWDYLEKFVEIPVEHIETDRIVGHKSIVDMKVATGICREFYQNNADSFILLSSDSDYWALISSLPEAQFLVMMETHKCGEKIKEIFQENRIYYCYIDDFCSGNIEDLKKEVLFGEAQTLLPRLSINGKEIVELAYKKAGISADPIEKTAFYNKFVKAIRLVIDDDGNVNLTLKSAI